MRHYISIIATLSVFAANAQQINPVPDYVFRNQMSVGRNAVTDTAAYFSVGPRYGAVKGMMPPMVIDTASMSATKRNGLLIFSIQKNKYLYWDSVGAKWAEMAGTAGSAITGSGVAGYMPEFTTSTNLDTTRLYHSAGRFGIGTTSPLTALHVNDEAMSSKLVVDTIGGLAYNSPWRATGVRTNFTGVTHWWGKTDASNGTAGGGDFTFFKSRRGDSALEYGNEIWYFQFRGKHRNNASSWSTNDSSNVANLKVNYALHSNNTPTAVYEFRAKNSSGNDAQYIIIDPVTNDVDINTARLDVQTNLRVQDNASILDTLKVGLVETINSNTFGRGMMQIASNGFSALNFTAYDALSANSGYIGLVRARGTASSPAVVQSGDFLGIIAFDGYHNPGNSFPSRGSVQIRAIAEETFSSTASGGSLRFHVVNTGSTSMTERMRIAPDGELWVGYTADQGSFLLQVNGSAIFNGSLQTAAPSGGTAALWRLGTVATVSPTSPNRTIEVSIGGTIYYLHAKTTND